jgi:hypothetical protein
MPMILINKDRQYIVNILMTVFYRLTFMRYTFIICTNVSEGQELYWLQYWEF